MELENYVPEHIQELCKKYKMTRYQLSQKAGISQSALSDIVKHNNMPTIYTLNKICIGFGISMSQFFEESDIIPNITEKQKEILELWIQLSPEAQRFFEICIRSMIADSPLN